MANSNKSKELDKEQNGECNAQLDVQATPVHEQEQSRLMQLPQELRDQIYSELFSSTQFTFKEIYCEETDTRRTVSTDRSYGLAILRTCRRIGLEIGSRWLGEVTFAFENPKSFLNKLANTTQTTRGQIRHVRLCRDPLVLCPGDDDVYYRTAQMLKFLPGLRLDVLTVTGTAVAKVSYQTLDMLVRHSDGWKELRYLSHDSELVGYRDDTRYFGASDHMLNVYHRLPQPTAWQAALAERDGEVSQPNVTMYRGTDASAQDDMLYPDKRTEHEQSFGAGQDASSYGKHEDDFLMQPTECPKKVLVVVKRGAGVDYSEKGTDFPIGDISEDFGGMSWQEIVADQEALFRDDDSATDSATGSDSEAEA